METTWKDRVHEERDDLAEKIYKLRAYLLKGPDIDALELAALQDQFQVMSRYLEILDDRISRF